MIAVVKVAGACHFVRLPREPGKVQIALCGEVIAHPIVEPNMTVTCKKCRDATTPEAGKVDP